MLCYVDSDTIRNTFGTILHHSLCRYYWLVALLFHFQLLHKTEHRVRATSTNTQISFFFFYVTMQSGFYISNVSGSMGAQCTHLHIPQCTCTAIVKWTLFLSFFFFLFLFVYLQIGVEFYFILRFFQIFGNLDTLGWMMGYWNICSGLRNRFCSVSMNVCHRFIYYWE